MRILLANEPRVYREVIAGALKELRPGLLLEVFDAAAEGLEEAVERVRPHLILCSRRLEAAVLLLGRAGSVLAWMMLYPEGEDRAEVRDALTGSTKRLLQGVVVEDLLRVVDETEQQLLRRRRA